MTRICPLIVSLQGSDGVGKLKVFLEGSGKLIARQESVGVGGQEPLDCFDAKLPR